MPKLVGDKFNPKKAGPVSDYLNYNNHVPVDYKTIIVDNKDERLDTLLQYAEGSLQKCVYFRQVLNEHDSVSQFSLDLSPASQQYDRIDGFELLLQGGINSSQQTDGLKTTEITAEAIVRQPIIPNVGDVVLMDFGRGTLGWFSVNSVRRMSHRRNTLYEITLGMNYEIFDQKTDKHMVNLNTKTIGVYQYSVDYLKAGQNPLLTPNTADAYRRIQDEYDRLLEYWWKKYHNRFYESCIVPNQSYVIYDGFYMRELRKWFSVSRVPELTYFRIFTDQEFPILRTTSIWEAITKQDKYLLKECFKRSVILNVKAFSNIPHYSGIRYSSLDAVIAPHEITYRNDIWLKNDVQIGMAKQIHPSVNKRTYQTHHDIPLIHPVNPGTSYVFSMDFYHDSVDGQSHLELQLRKYFDKLSTDVEIIELLLEDAHNWAELEQYYYLPVLLLLTQYTVRTMHNV